MVIGVNFELGIHLKGGLNQDVKKPTLRRFFTFQPRVGGSGRSENAII